MYRSMIDDLSTEGYVDVPEYDRLYRNTEGCIGEQMGVSECVRMYRSMGDVPSYSDIMYTFTAIVLEICSHGYMDLSTR